MTRNVRNLVQVIIIKTSFPPLSLLYKMLYLGAVKLAVHVLRDVRGVKAIYLRRSVSHQEIIYGLSDIDLSVIVDDEKKTGVGSVKQEVSSAYDKLSHIVPLFGQADRELGLYSTSEFFGLYANHPFFRYRFNQGKQDWKLLFGEDIVESLPELQDNGLYLPATEELKIWWWSLLNAEVSSAHRLAQFKKKYLWYKAIADASKVYLFVCQGEKISHRETALHNVRKYLSQEQNRCIDQLQRYVKNLTAADRFVANDLMRLFIELTRSAFGEMERKVDRGSIKKRARLPIFERNNLIIDRKASNKIEEIENYIQKEVASYLDYVAFTPQIYLGLDVLRNSDIDSIHVILAQKEFIPVKKLRDLRSLVEECSSPQRIEPLIKNGNVVLSLLPETECESIKSQKQYPLVFTLMNYFPLDIIKSLGEEKLFQSHLPPHFDNSIRTRVARIDDLVSNPHIYKMRPLSFLRFFWGATRTKLLNYFLKNDHIYIPLTSKQICDLVSQLFPEESEWLNDLYGEYKKELEKKESQAYRFFTKSIDFLKKI